MVDKYPKAFISSTFDEELSYIIDYFCEIIRSCGFRPILLKNIGAKPIPEKIREAIESCDIYLAIVLKSPSHYILNELGMAYSLRKPILILREQSITFNGIADNITDIKPFKLTTYWLVSPHLVEYLTAFLISFQQQYSIKEYIVRKSVRSLIKIDLDRIQTTTEVELLNLSESLSEINHGLLFYNEREATKINELSFHFEVLYPLWNYQVKKWRTSTSLSFTVQFQPPLKQSQIIKYMYRQEITNHLPMTLQQLKTQSMNGQPSITSIHCEKNYTISTPTDSLDISIVFPPKYHIRSAEVIPFYYKADVPLTDELERINSNNYFKVSDFAGVITITLCMPFPKLFTRYSLRWLPYE